MAVFGASIITLPMLSRILTLCLENVAVQSWAQSGAIAVRELERSVSRKMWASIRGPAGDNANCVDAMDWIVEPFGSATCMPFEARMGKFFGMSLRRRIVSVAPVSARVMISVAAGQLLVRCCKSVGIERIVLGVEGMFVVIEKIFRGAVNFLD